MLGLVALADLPVALGAGSDGSVSQNYINQIILSKLSHLVNMEKIKSLPNKTSDVSEVKSSANKVKHVKAQVTQHRSDINATSSAVRMYTRRRSKIALGSWQITPIQVLKNQVAKGDSVDVFVSNRVKWPHEFVLSCQNKDMVSYNQLSPIQWMGCFSRTIREESNVHTRENMLYYVINLLEDAQDFSWSSAKACHAVLLCRM